MWQSWFWTWASVNFSEISMASISRRRLFQVVHSAGAISNVNVAGEACITALCEHYNVPMTIIPAELQKQISKTLKTFLYHVQQRWDKAGRNVEYFKQLFLTRIPSGKLILKPQKLKGKVVQLKLGTLSQIARRKGKLIIYLKKENLKNFCMQQARACTIRIQIWNMY